MKTVSNASARVAPPNRWQLTFWFQLATWGLLAATLAGGLGSFFFLFELCSHFAVQYAVIAALLLIGWLYSRSWLLAVISALSLLINGLPIRPWLAHDEHPFTNQYDARVLHANVLFTGTDYARIVQLVRAHKPDLFVLQEMTPESIRGVAALRQTFPYQYHIWSKGPCFILVGSRNPIQVDMGLDSTLHVISLKTTVRGREMALLTVHPQIPLLPSWFTKRNKQLAFVAKQARRERLPTVLIGDFNISVFSPVYNTIFYAPFEAHLTACRRGFGLQPTWPRYLPPMFIPIDHAFVNSGFRPVNFQTFDQPGSDHKAVVVDLAFARSLTRP